MTRTFDATVDFNAPGQLEYELELALFGVNAGTTFSVWIRAEGDGCETGQVYTWLEELPVAAVRDRDWLVTADSVADAAAQLRALL